MTKKARRGILSVAIVAVALGLLFYTTASTNAEYYKHVDEVAANPQQWYGKSIQLHGFVVDKSIFEKPDTLQYRFEIQNNGKVMPATYQGVVPDTFKGGSEVVLKGHLGPNGFVVSPDGVMAKCPSKYTAAAAPPPPQ